MADRHGEAMTTLRDLGIAITAAVVVLTASLFWSATGMTPAAATMAPWMDFVITGYVALLLCMLQRRRTIAAIVVAAPVTSFVIGGTGVLNAFNEPLNLRHLLLIDEGIAYYDLAPVVWGAGISLAGAFVWNLRRPNRYFVWALAPLLALGLIFAGKFAMHDRERGPVMSNINWWHGDEFSSDVGYFVGFALDALVHAERRESYRRLLADSKHPKFDDFITSPLPPLASEPRSVHLILVESLIDPTRNKEVQFNRDPFPDAFRAWIKQQKAHGLSPVFGARSPDAEFEILCGIPASLDDKQVVMAELAVEELDCLPRKLARLGWHTIAAHPIAPEIFRTGRSYRILGFNEARFAPDFDMTDRDSGHFPAGIGKVPVLDSLASASLLEQFSDVLRPRLKAKQRLFSYAFLTGGHYPFGLDESKRPLVIQTEPMHDLYTRYANAVHYNTRAIQEYVQRIYTVDPTALVIIIGDHGPPLGEAVRVTADGGTGEWDALTLRHRVPFVMLRAGKVVAAPVTVVPAYLVPEIIVNTLSQGAYCRANRCRKDGQRIFRPLADRVLAYDRTGRRLADCKPDSDPTPACAEAKRFHEISRLRLLTLLFPSPAS